MYIILNALWENCIVYRRLNFSKSCRQRWDVIINLFESQGGLKGDKDKLTLLKQFYNGMR